MHGFQHFLQSIFVIVACLSDWFLAFDLWIVTPGQWPTVEYFSRPVLNRKRWMTTLKTTVFYALAEPILYVAMVRVTANASFPLLLSSFMAISAAQICVQMILSGLEHLKKQHEELCGNALQDDPQSLRQTEPYADEQDDVEELKAEDFKEDDNLLIEDRLEANVEGANAATQPSSLPEQNESSSSDNQPNRRKPFVRGPHCPHEQTLTWKLAPLVPTLLSAAANAGLLYYVRSFDSEFSLEWLDRFAFGWTAIALLSLFCYFVGKWVNRMVMMVTFRHPLDIGDRKNWPHEFLIRVSSFLVFFVLRALQRLVLGLHPVAMPSVNVNGTALILTSDVKIGNFTAIETDGANPEDIHIFDRIFTNMPSWTRWVFPIVNIAIALFYFVYNRKQKKARIS